jgi:uncharacterized protein (DUF433 family)
MLIGHRISLYHVVSRYKQGLSVEQLHEYYPTLTLDLIDEVLAFYHANQTEVDDYVAAYREVLDRQEAAAPRVNWEELRRRYKAKKREGTKKRGEAQ